MTNGDHAPPKKDIVESLREGIDIEPDDRPRAEKLMEEAADEIERLKEALEKIAKQKNLGELITEHGEDGVGDFQYAYDAIIQIARAAPAPQEQKQEANAVLRQFYYTYGHHDQAFDLAITHIQSLTEKLAEAESDYKDYWTMNQAAHKALRERHAELLKENDELRAALEEYANMEKEGTPPTWRGTPYLAQSVLAALASSTKGE